MRELIRVILAAAAALCALAAFTGRHRPAGANARWLAVFLGLLAAFPQMWPA
jgi:hypothetical protein